MKRQKPSERIKEIAMEKYSPLDFSSHIKALEDYLDEEYEKQQKSDI